MKVEKTLAAAIEKGLLVIFYYDGWLEKEWESKENPANHTAVQQRKKRIEYEKQFDSLTFIK